MTLSGLLPNTKWTISKVNIGTPGRKYMAIGYCSGRFRHRLGTDIETVTVLPIQR